MCGLPDPYVVQFKGGSSLVSAEEHDEPQVEGGRCEPRARGHGAPLADEPAQESDPRAPHEHLEREEAAFGERPVEPVVRANTALEAVGDETARAARERRRPPPDQIRNGSAGRR